MAIPAGIWADTTNGATTSHRIALLIPHQDPFWLRLASLTTKAAEDLHDTVDVTVFNDDTDAMLAAAKAAIQRGVDGLIFPGFRGAGPHILRLAEEASVPAIVINTPLQDQSLRPRQQFTQWIGSIWPDDVQAGELLITQLLSLAGDRPAHVLAIAGAAGDKPSVDREKGLRDGLASVHDLQSLTLLHADWNADKAKKAFLAAMAKNPDISIVWCANDNMAGRRGCH